MYIYGNARIRTTGLGAKVKKREKNTTERTHRDAHHHGSSKYQRNMLFWYRSRAWYVGLLQPMQRPFSTRRPTIAAFGVAQHFNGTGLMRLAHFRPGNGSRNTKTSVRLRYWLDGAASVEKRGLSQDARQGQKTIYIVDLYEGQIKQTSLNWKSSTQLDL